MQGWAGKQISMISVILQQDKETEAGGSLGADGPVSPVSTAVNDKKACLKQGRRQGPICAQCYECTCAPRCEDAHSVTRVCVAHAHTR